MNCKTRNMESFCKIRYLMLETECLPSHVWPGLPFYVWKIPPVFCCSSVFGSWGQQSKQRYQTFLSPGHLFKCNLWFCKCADTLLWSLSKSWLSICRMLIGCQVHRELWGKKKSKIRKYNLKSTDSGCSDQSSLLLMLSFNSALCML